MKLFVVSDIHGYCTVLKEALDRAGFDPHREDHLLVCLGDYFDKGDESAQVLEFFQGLKRKVLLRGNHEDMLLRLLKTGKVLPHHRINGTGNTLKSFFGKDAPDLTGDTVDFSPHTAAVDRLCAFIEATVDYYETEGYVFVHGWLPEGSDTPEAWEKARCAKWTDLYRGERPLSHKTLICGHVPTFCADGLNITPQTKGDTIFHGNGLIAIDAGTHDTKKINVLVLDEI